jgi:hypothetical protein
MPPKDRTSFEIDYTVLRNENEIVEAPTMEAAMEEIRKREGSDAHSIQFIKIERLPDE